VMPKCWGMSPGKVSVSALASLGTPGAREPLSREDQETAPHRPGQRPAAPFHSQTAAITAARVPWWEDPFMMVNGFPQQIITVRRRGPNRLLGTPKQIPFRSDRRVRPASFHEVT
jgi:hypothetical protein